MEKVDTKDRLLQVLEGKEGNYLYPFFWQHGSSKEVLEEYIEKIYEAGCRGFCVESRPHPDFLGDGWWKDMDVILHKAEELNMKVWILDDSHFPTGFANGKVSEARDSWKRWYLVHREIDFSGPVDGGKISIYAENGVGGLVAEDEILVAAILAKHTREGDLSGDCVLADMTDDVKNGWLTVQLPEGKYRLYLVVKCIEHVEYFKGYMDAANPESVKLLLEEVYEKHYLRYPDKFGTVITGFFSDEPGFYNTVDEKMYSFNSQIGSDMRLPWNPYIASEFQGMLEKNGLLKEDETIRMRSLLPALWFPFGEKFREIQATYMDALTRLYQKNFTGQIAKWCHAHGVSYVGHVIEDNNSHARLGAGCGHYFRAVCGMDMAGIDTVILQILPGADGLQVGLSSGKEPLDGDFYFYGLAKLGASMAHIEKQTCGRALCEIFGAYGWGEGIRLMKWLADHMLVRGVNTFVPHAFSEKTFPDQDGPPHFYARGYNPQYRYMNRLFTYMNRMCHLFNGGRSMAKVGIWYHAESEWLGRTMYFHTIGKELAKHQIDYDVISLDYLEQGTMENGQLCVGQLHLSVLLIPLAERYPQKLRDFVKRCKKIGIKVYQITGDLPDGCRTGAWWYPAKGTETELLEDCIPYALDEMIPVVKKEINEVTFEPETEDGTKEWLRYYHYEMENGRHGYLFFNESLTCKIKGSVHFPDVQKLYYYDAYENKLYRASSIQTDQIPLELYGGETKVYIAGDMEEMVGEQELDAAEEQIQWSAFLGKVTISTADYRDMSSFRKIQEMDLGETDGNMDLPKSLENGFSGILRYELELWGSGEGRCFLDLGQVREAVQVWVNGEEAGTRIGDPFQFEITPWIKKGKNKIRMEVATRLVYALRDSASKYMVLLPEGIHGPIRIGSLL